MKKLKLTIILLTSLLILFSIPVISKAAGSFSATASKTTVTVGDTFTVTAKATNATGICKISVSDSSKVSVSGEAEKFLENNSDTWTLTAKKAGNVTITVTAVDLIDSEDDTKTVTGSKTFSVTVKDKATNNSSGGNTSSGSSSGNSSGGSSGNTSSGSSSSGNSGSSSGSSGNTSTGNSSSSSGSNTNSTKPTFKSTNKKVYTTNDVNLRSSWSTSSSALQVKSGTELTLTGTSTEIVNGYIWYRVTYNGATKYIASNFVTETKPEEVDYPEDIKSANNSLDSLKIEGVTLSPTFSSSVLEYTATLEEDLTKLNITAKTVNNKAKVKIEGNENLKEGTNIIKLTVTAENGSTKTYTVKVIKGDETAVAEEPSEDSNDSNNNDVDNSVLKLQSLEISGVEFNGVFNPDEHYYELNLNFAVENLDIKAVANRENATIEILGNSDFKEGENLVTILVKSADGKEAANYQIKVNLSRGVIQQKSDTVFYIKCVAIAFAVLLVVLVIVIASKKGKKKNNKLDYTNLKETMPTANMYKEEIEKEKMQDDEEESDDENKKFKSSRGKHSV